MFVDIQEKIMKGKQENVRACEHVFVCACVGGKTALFHNKIV